MGRDAGQRQGRTMRKSATSKGMGNMRGSVSGSLWALVLGGVGLGVASQISGPPAQLASVEEAVATVETPENAPEATETTSADTVETVPDEVESTSEVATETTTAEEETDDVTSASDELEVPELDDEAPTDVVIAPDRPVVPGATGAATPVVNATGESAPELPEPTTTPDAVTETPLAIDEDPEIALTEAPSALETPTEIADAPTEPAAPETRLTPGAQALLDALSQEAESAPLQADLIEPEIPVVPVDDLVPDVPVLDAPAEPEIINEPAPEIEVATQEQVEPAEPVQPVVEEPVIEPTEAPSETTAEAEQEAQTDDVADDGDQPTARNGVRVNRLGAEPTDQPGQEAEVVADAEVADTIPAIARFGADFDNPLGLPTLSFALIDDGSISDLASALTNSGLPITVILDPLADDAASRMAALRAAGIEVGFQASLPSGATPADVEVAMEAALGSLPETVTLFSNGQDGVQQSRAVTGQVLAVLAAEGRGLVIEQRGLGNAVRTAAQAGVPTAQIVRNIDDSGQNEAAIGRSLDQAAFRARQTGASVLTGTLNGFNLAALAAWAPSVNQEQLLLAPVSGVLRGTAGN